VLQNKLGLNYISQAEDCAFDPRRPIQIFYGSRSFGEPVNVSKFRETSYDISAPPATAPDAWSGASKSGRQR
jgi:hypothetical protein